MDSLVRTSDSTGRHYSALAGPLWPTTGPTMQAQWTHKISKGYATRRHTEAHKISKAERTPMAHKERTGIALVPHRAHRKRPSERTGIAIG